MLSDKEVKKKFKAEASKNPDKYYATNYLKEKGFERKKCTETGIYFWTKDSKRNVSGDAAVSGGFTFLNEKLSDKKMDYLEIWKEFSAFFSKRGYTTINRYPVVARWRDDMEFVIASISDFQPYVVNGEVDPPANPLIIPQLCIRFNDIDNVGVTMSHNTCFVMIGQHAFRSEKDWDQEKYFKDLVEWFVEGMKINLEDLIFHEDAWAGGGNFGPCMEIFCGGVELANQVYMAYEQTPLGNRELDIKVLDMGLGHERIAWFSQGEGTIYDAAFPTVMQKLVEKTGVKIDKKFLKDYIPYGSYLNLDETEDINKSWKLVANKLGIDTAKLKDKLKLIAGLYSVAEHSRTLLVAISDGALPSNVKGGYNLRVILRRALQFIEDNNWNIDIGEVCEWHAAYLEPIFPELSENLKHVKKIINVEKEKYEESKERNRKIIQKIIGTKITTEKLIELYDSNGINPEAIKKEAEKMGGKVSIPDNFYSLVAEKHENKEQSTQTKKTKSLNLEGIKPTKLLYYEHYDLVDFDAFVEKIIKDKDRTYIVLNQTAFYPTSGGQIHDLGTINGIEVIDVFKQKNIVVHEVKNCNFSESDKVTGKIDFARREQLAQHHTATHILTGAARRVLGDHIWQAGASKTLQKSRLDITHYSQLTDEELKKIEVLANEIVRENKPVYKSFMKRNLAEAKHGIRIYQGGAVPGNLLRIVEIPNFDAEACGGTHLDVTGDVGSIKIIKTSKIQDGILRLEFVAGAASEKYIEKERKITHDALKILGGTPKQMPARAEELFQKWKKAKKGKLTNLKLESTEEYEGDVIEKTAQVLKTQPEHIVKTLTKFKESAEKNLK